MVVRKADKNDYPYIYRFLSDNYECGTYFNWDIGRLCFTRYAENNGINGRSYDEWISDMYLWIRDNEIVGMVHTEEPWDYFIQVSKNYKNLENSDGFETLSWLVRKENEIIAYTMGFVDSNYEYIHLYPIAVRQEFLNTQALDMMLDETTRDIKKRKIKYSVISAWYKPEEDEKFRVHGYVNEHHVLFYEVPINELFKVLADAEE